MVMLESRILDLFSFLSPVTCWHTMQSRMTINDKPESAAVWQYDRRRLFLTLDLLLMNI